MKSSDKTVRFPEDEKNSNKKKHKLNKKNKMDEFEYELSKLVGLNDLKFQLRKLAKGMLMDKKRQAMGETIGQRKKPHMAFLGNPGTGKTVVARLIGKLLHVVGLLSTPKVVEVQRTDLVGQYIGQTGPKTRAKVQEAMGGVLFVDEAYNLAPNNNRSSDYGKEALEEIMSVMEDGNLVIIFAGYTELMENVFSLNRELKRRVPHVFKFDDYTCDQLAEMLIIKMNKQDAKSWLYGFKLHPSCTHKSVRQVIKKYSTEKLRKEMNRGLIDHVLNNAKENLDSRLRLDSKSIDEIMTITLSDLKAGLQLLAGVNVQKKVVKRKRKNNA